MKLHLPLSLLSAVLLVAAGLSSRAQAVEVPSDYTPHNLADPDDLYDYRTTSGNLAFLLDSSITFTPSSATWWTPSQELKENGSILFTIEEDGDLYSLTYKGGANKAFHNVSTLAIEDIGRVTFEGLKESDFDSYSTSSYSYYYYYYYYGGAIHATTLRLKGNSRVTFNGNEVSAVRNESYTYLYAHGGAIYGAKGASITETSGAVTFAQNKATGSSSSISASYSYGGAIYGGSSSTISICDNGGDVSFTGNSSSSAASALGGAIYSEGSLYLQNNGNTLIAGNYEKEGSNYRLRSIYMKSTASDGGHFHLSAAAGKSIEFRDSVYIGSYVTVGLNADYTTSEGNVIKQEGDIIFTGAYTETHLNELLTADGAGRTATAEEIANSRTSEMHGKVTLYGGTLRVEEQAVLKTTAGLNVAAGSNANVKVSNAELDAGSSDINIGESGSLTLTNGATVRAENINIADGASFAVVGAPSQEAAATFSLREAASVAEPPQSCLVDANLTLEAGSTLVADGVYFSMAEGSTLTFKALTGGDKINLVLTLGAEYSDNEQVVLFSDVDVARFILDGVELNVTDTILANTFFTGAWVNDETTLSYDSSSGTISLQHLNTVTIPEPTTATLSLLALAALAARRRRK